MAMCPPKPMEWVRVALIRETSRRPKITVMELSSSSVEMEGPVQRTLHRALWESGRKKKLAGSNLMGVKLNTKENTSQADNIIQWSMVVATLYCWDVFPSAGKLVKVKERWMEDNREKFLMETCWSLSEIWDLLADSKHTIEMSLNGPIKAWTSNQLRISGWMKNIAGHKQYPSGHE